MLMHGKVNMVVTSYTDFLKPDKNKKNSKLLNFIYIHTRQNNLYNNK